MATNDKENWVVSRIDSEGVYHGGVAVDGDASNSNFRTKATGEILLLNVTTSKFHEIFIQDVNGTPTLMIAETGEV